MIKDLSLIACDFAIVLGVFVFIPWWTFVILAKILGGG